MTPVFFPEQLDGCCYHSLYIKFRKSIVHASGVVKKQLVITNLEAKGKFMAGDINLEVFT